MGKGVLLELDGHKAVVLTQQGEFKRVPVPKGTWDIGDEIDFAETRNLPWARWGAVAAAAVLMLVVAPAGYNTWALAQPAAVVTIDINPSVQLTLNKVDEVLDAKALNDDGALVLKGVDWKRHPVDQVVADVTHRAVEEHKLDPADEAGAVVVAVVPPKETELPKAHADRLRDKADVAVRTELTQAAKAKGAIAKANVAVVEATVKDKHDAESQGLTPGKLFLYQQLKEQVPQVEPEQLKEHGPGRVMKDLHINPGIVFPEMEKKHGGEPESSKKDDTQQAQPANGKGSDDGKGKPADDKKDNKDQGKGKSEGNKAGANSVDDNRSKGAAQQGNGETRAEEKKDAWKVPFLPIEIPKPNFLKDKEKQKEQPKQRAEEENGSTASTPRATTPGAGAPVVTPPAPTAPTAPAQSGNGKSEEKKPADKPGSDKQDEKANDNAGKTGDTGSDHGNGSDKGNGKH